MDWKKIQYEERWTDWSGRIYSLAVLEEDDFPIGGVVDELRPPVPADAEIPIFDVLDFIQLWISEHEELSHDYGTAELPIVQSNAFDRLQQALDDYIHEHVDLSQAAWQPTGRFATRTETGWTITPPYPEETND